MSGTPNINPTVLVSDLAPDLLHVHSAPGGGAGPDGDPGPPGFGAFEQDYVATTGQTSFTLPATPFDATLVLMIVDHLIYYPTLDFTVSGNVVNWIGAPTTFNFIGGEDVRIYF